MIHAKPVYSRKIYLVLKCVFVWIFFSALNLSHGNINRDLGVDMDILLNFRHPAVGRYYISAVLSGDSVYLPMAELFSLLYVHFEQGTTPYSLQGTYQYPGKKWYINPYERKALIGNKHLELSNNDFRIGDMELYVAPWVFGELFGLHFNINMNALSVGLHSEHMLPVQYRQTREQARLDLKNEQTAFTEYLMLYPRKRRLFGAGMVDYNLGMTANKASQAYNYNIISGMEFMGGDLVFGLSGSHNSIENKEKNINSEYLWRYVFEDNSYLTNFGLGLLRTSGVFSQRVTGFFLSNEPVIPRRIYESIMIDGTTVPESDVELYVNNQMTDHVRADEAGYYRFDYPLHYGTARIRIRIFKPSGEITIEESQVQVPYSFLPAGVWAYNIQGGLNNEQQSAIENYKQHTLHGNFAYGVSNKITAKAGIDYVSDHMNPLYYTSVSMRAFSRYLLNLDVVANNFMRFTASHNFASRHSIMVRYTEFSSQSILTNPNTKRELNTNLYWPFRIWELPFGIRLGSDYFVNVNGHNINSLRVDLNTRIKQMNLRFNYRERMLQHSQTHKPEYQKTLGLRANYSLRHKRHLPQFISGFSVRKEIQYDPSNKQIITAGLHLSRNIMGSGRLQVSADHDFQQKIVMIKGTLSVNIQPFRSSTHVTGHSGGPYMVQQNIAGSVGYDSESSKLIATNRHQVGQGAVSLIMFVDDNNNGKYDIGEKIVPAMAVRLNQGASMLMGKDSVLRINHLQAYWTYHAEIMHTALNNPGLVSLNKEFSFVADPNVYKRMEIPLYRTGVIDGMVAVESENNTASFGGIRLLLEDIDRGQSHMVRTFADGGFYAMELLPGNYKISIDPVQLTFLNKQSKPPNIAFAVKPLAEGHYVSDLDFVLVPEKPPKQPVVLSDKTQTATSESPDDKLRMHLHYYVIAQNHFNDGLYDDAVVFIDKALQLFETDYGMSLKASLLYLSGSQPDALLMWDKIYSKNPGILLPDRVLLEKLKKRQ